MVARVDYAEGGWNKMTTGTPTKEYVRPMPANWWLKKPAYFKFMACEFSAIFIAGYCIFLLFLLYKAGKAPPAEFQTLFERLREPPAMILHGIALFLALVNTFTFLNLTPRVLVIFRGDEKVSETVIVALHYIAFFAASIGLVLLVKFVV